MHNEFVFMNRPGKRFKRPKRGVVRDRSRSRLSQASTRHRVQPTEEGLLPSSNPVGGRQNTQDRFFDATTTFQEQHPQTGDLLRSTLQEVSEFLQLSLQKMDEAEEEEHQRADWRFMAMALDRACLFFYALLILVLFVWIFAATPSPSTPPKDFANPIQNVN